MNFAEALNNERRTTFTENGAKAFSTTDDNCLDLFSTIGSLRSATDERIKELFTNAYTQNPLLATKILFYSRDIREGLGERKTFRTLLKYAAEKFPDAISENIHLIGEYGRYDDLYELIGTPLEWNMWCVMKNQFETDRKAMSENKPISMLAKWIKTPDASSRNTRALGIRTAQMLGYSVRNFKRILREMRAYTNVVEQKMSAHEWSDITYSIVPGKAMALYRTAFAKHDAMRYKEFVNAALEGKTEIKSATMYPYDFVKHVFNGTYDDTLEAQWRQLPNYVDPDCNILVMADVSGSMSGRPMETAIGLATYFAERNTGAYHDLFMTFSEKPDIIKLRGNTLAEKFKNMKRADWGMSTNLESAFDKILDIALDNSIKPEEMPRALVIISDMEFNEANRDTNVTFYDAMVRKYRRAGYEMPNIVFWNVNSRNDVFHADKDCSNVQLVSGNSTSTFKTLVTNLNTTPLEYMYATINSDRYMPIKLAS